MQESERVEECDIGKKVCDVLHAYHEGILHVRETRIIVGIRMFEIFLMEEGVTIDENYTRFTTIT
jgi:hypothetical protein